MMRFLIFVKIFTFSLLACATTKELSDHWVYREAQVFKQALYDLQEQSAKTCAAEALRAEPELIKAPLKEPYLKAMKHWQRLSVSDMENGLPSTYKMSFHFFPDRGARVKKKVKEHLMENELIDLAFVEEAIFYSTSLSAYEILLFDKETGFDELVSKRLENFCALLVYIPQKLIAKHLVYEEKLEQYLTDYDVKNYRTDALNSLVTSLELIKKNKISSGIDFENGRIRVLRLENYRSQKALENINHNLQAQKEIFDEIFAPLLLEGDFDSSLDYVNLGYSKTADLIASFTGPLSEISTDDENYSRAKKLYGNISLLIRALKKRIATELEIPIFFNGADGD